MTFAHPSLVFVALAAIPLLALGFMASWRVRKRLITQFVPRRLQEALTLGVSPRRAAARAVLLILGMFLLLLALARPRLGAGTVEVSQRGLDILVGIDTSRSMLAEDAGAGVSRLQRAKLAALDLAKLARNDRIGLVAFAGSAFLQCPLTIDFEAFRQSVEALDTSVIQQGGTSVGSAIHAAIDAVSEEQDNVRVLVLFTDGEEHEAGALDAAKRAESKGLRIYTVGVGSPKGEIIALRDGAGAVTYLKDSQGNVVKSSLNEPLLTQVATATGGFYLPLQGPRVMSELYIRALEPLPKADYQARQMEDFLERFQFPLGFAILFFLWEALLPETARVGTRLRASRRTHPTLTPPSPVPSSASTGLVAALVFVALAAWAHPSAWASPASALRSYRAADYPAAQAEFERLAKEKPTDPRLRFNAGAAAFRAGDLEAASRHFQDSLASTDLRLQSDAFYNLGNTQFRLGEQVPDAKVRQKAWEQSIQALEAAVKLAPRHTNAQHNLDYVRQRLEDLKQEQKQEQPPSKGDDQKPSDDQKPPESSESDSKKNQDQKPQDDQDNPNPSQDSKPPEDNDSQAPKETPESENQDSQESKDQAGQDSEKPSPDAQQPSKDTAQNGENAQGMDQAPAGEMTPRQALRLLDAAKGEEKLMPLEKKRARPRTIKDW